MIFIVTGLIYIIRNKINNKVYIGQTTLCMNERWKAHLKPSTHKTKGKYKLYNAMQKYGKENFYYEILEEDIPRDELDQKEIDYIEKFDSFFNGYNSTKGGDGRYINNNYDVKKIVEEYKKGNSSAVIAKTYNVDQVTIRRILHSVGVSLRQDGRKFDDSMKDEVIAMATTHTYREVAAYYKVDEKTVRRFLKKHNFRKRTKKLLK